MDHKWIDELFDEIDEVITESKQVKFNTHKNRKVLMGQIKSMVIDAIEQNTTPKAPSVRATTATITRPNPHKSLGHAVMNKAASERADVNYKGEQVPPLPESARFR
jgi:hypothetical protein